MIQWRGGSSLRSSGAYRYSKSEEEKETPSWTDKLDTASTSPDTHLSQMSSRRMSPGYPTRIEHILDDNEDAEIAAPASVMHIPPNHLRRCYIYPVRLLLSLQPFDFGAAAGCYRKGPLNLQITMASMPCSICIQIRNGDTILAAEASKCVKMGRARLAMKGYFASYMFYVDIEVPLVLLFQALFQVGDYLST